MKTHRLLLAAIFCSLVFASCAVAEVKDGFNKVQLPDNGSYEGDIKDGLFDGKGTLISGDGSRYDGEFQEGRFNGRGILTFGQGNKFEGTFVKGLPSGKGVLTDISGKQKNAELKDGKWVIEQASDPQ
jgi:hypothetical protein